MDEAIFDNPYVQTAVPIAMGIAAASSPAGARGASALLTTLGTMQQFSGQRLKKELANRPQFQAVGADKEPAIFNPATGQLVPAQYPGYNPGLRIKAMEAMNREVSPPSAQTPTPGPPSVAPAQQGGPQVTLSRPEGVTFSPELERQIAAAEAVAQPALQQAQPRVQQALAPQGQGAQEPPAHWDPELQKMWRMAQTDQGLYLIAMAGSKAQQTKYFQDKAKYRDEVNAALSKQAALMPGAVEEERQKAEVRFPYQLEVSRAQGERAPSVAANVERQKRLEKLEALQPLTIRQARRAGIAPDLANRQFFDITTAQMIPEGRKLAEVEALEDQGLVKSTSDPSEIKELHALRSIAPLVKSMMADTAKVWGPGGVLENLKPEDRLLGATKGGWARLFQTRPELSNYLKSVQAKATIIASSIEGAKGTQTEGDVTRTIGGLPSASGIPDTQAVAYEVMNSLARIVNDRFGAIFGKDGYQYPGLTYLQAAPQQTVPSVAPTQSPYQQPLSPEGQKALEELRQKRSTP